jgi:hypothetical protein
MEASPQFNTKAVLLSRVYFIAAGVVGCAVALVAFFGGITWLAVVAGILGIGLLVVGILASGNSIARFAQESVNHDE